MTEAPYITAFRRAAIPPPMRGILEFAEAEVVFDQGPFEGRRFSVDRTPFVGLVLPELANEDGWWRTITVTGPAQGSKSFCANVVLPMYRLYELRQDHGIGGPTLDSVHKLWRQKLEPAILASRFRDTLPKSGAGSKRGKFVQARLSHGPLLFFYGAQGGDEQRSGDTISAVSVTELDKMSTSGGVSQETDPAHQILARTRAYGEDAYGVQEGTLTVAEGRTWQEIAVRGSNGRIFIRCPHCGCWILPDREHFVGWQDAENEVEAGDNARYACNHCGQLWDEADRHEANKHPRLVHDGPPLEGGGRDEGQHVESDGTVAGTDPKTWTRRCGIRWNWMNMPREMVSMKQVAEEELAASKKEEHSPEQAELEKDLSQFRWVIPYEAPGLNLNDIDREVILRKIGGFTRGVCPPDTQHLVMHIDLGLHVCRWTAMTSGTRTERNVIDYGAVNVYHDDPDGTWDNEKRMPTHNGKIDMLAALRSFRRNRIEAGWKFGDKVRTPDVVLVDSGSSFAEVAYAFVKESGRRYHAAKGLGSSSRQDNWRDPAKRKGRRLGPSGHWYTDRQRTQFGMLNLVLMDSDHYKREVHRGFADPTGAPGNIQLFKGDRKTHKNFAGQICAEREEQQFVPGRGLITRWNARSKNNHGLDNTYGCLAGLDILGEQIIDVPKQKTQAASDGYAAGDGSAPSSSGWKIGR